MIQVNSETLQDMRDWVEDCAVDNTDLENRQDATEREIIQHVKKNYSGGIKQFMADSVD